MTACVNNEKEIKGGVSGKVLRTVAAGVLAMSMMPAAALATTGADDAEAAPMSAVPGTNNFADGTFGWSVDKNSEGKYVVEAGDAFYLTSIADVFGTPSSVSDVTVVYIDWADVINYEDKTNAFALFSGKPYDTKGTYKAVVFDKVFDVTECKTWGDVLTKADGCEHKEVTYSVVSKPLAGSYFYEGLDTADTALKYTGNPKVIHLADAEGNAIDDDQYDVKSGNVSEKNAGTYTVVIEGAKDTVYEGSLATVKYTIAPIDLANDTFTIDMAEDGVLIGDQPGDGKLKNTSVIYVNGEQLADEVVDATVSAALEMVNGELQASTQPKSSTGENPGIYTFDIVPFAGAGQTPSTEENFVNANTVASAEMTVVDNLADVYYGAGKLADWSDNADQLQTFVTSKGQAFNPDSITAWNGSASVAANQVSRSVTVTKDGEPVTDYSEPGTYTVTVEVAAPSDFAYGAKVTKKFNVVANQFSEQPTVYWQMADGTQNAQEYTGGEIAPEILVKAGSETLAAGTDYQVTYEDKNGNAVESPVEPGKYYVTVDFGGSYYKTGLTGAPTACGKVEFDYTIDKATIESAEADKDVYDMTGEAVKPIFTAYTNDDLTGLSVEIDPDKTPVTYYEAVWSNGNTADDPTDDKWVPKTGDPIKAANLKDEGFYIAKVNAPIDDPHFKGAVESEVFEIAETAKFDDVDAGAWYANSVYAAYDLEYMKGVAGTRLFMPEASISREQIASVLFNMAGQAPAEGIYYPTGFADADGWAWYAQAVAWAAEAGVMGGYAGTDTFGVGDDTTREQVAAIFYNYAKAQGKDVSVADVDAALAKVADADTVSDWAKPAVAWAVENGIMGNGGYVWAQDNITRAQVAAMAVNFQPEALK